MGQFDYVEPSPSAPQNSPEAVDRGAHGRAQDGVGGEVEHRGGCRVQRVTHTQTVASRTTANDTHPFTKSCLAYYQRRWSDHVNLVVEVALSLNLRSQDE